MKALRSGFNSWLVLTNSSYIIVTYLSRSADGKIDGKACHLSAIILQSMKNSDYVGTKEE